MREHLTGKNQRSKCSTAVLFTKAGKMNWRKLALTLVRVRTVRGARGHTHGPNVLAEEELVLTAVFKPILAR